MHKNMQQVQTQLLTDIKLLPLSSFKSKKVNKFDIFPDAKQLPLFFSYNLLNEGRVVKMLKGHEAIWRGFYYQLMKLGFQIENPRDDYAQVIKNIIFSHSEIQNDKNSSPISGKQYSNRQYLKIIADFMQLLENQVIPNFQMTLNQYPIFDEAMLNCLEYLLQKNLKEKIAQVQSIVEVLQALCNIFEIQLETYDNCVRFVESDVFLYFENSHEIYLAFLNEMAEIDECQKTSSEVISKDKEIKDFSNQTSNIQSLQQYTYFNDIRLSAGNQNRRKPKNPAVVGRQSTGGLVQKPTPQSAIINVFDSKPSVEKQSRQFIEEDLIETKKYANKYQLPKSQKQGLFKNTPSLQSYNEIKEQSLMLGSKIKTIQSDDPFYRPEQKTIKKKRQEIIEQKNESVGTFYRQFTDTKIMEAMIEPHKTNVNRTRNRFKGVHRNNFFGLH